MTGIVEIDAVHAALTEAARWLNGALVRERSFSADMAHQLRTPLASLRLRLETEQLRVGRGNHLAEEALADVDRIQQTIDDLLILSRDTERTRTPNALSSVLRDAATRWAPQLAAANRRLDVAVEPLLPLVAASPSSIRQFSTSCWTTPSPAAPATCA